MLLSSAHVINNRIYLVQGGTTVFYYSDIKQDGTLSSWTLSDSLPVAVNPSEQGTDYKVIIIYLEISWIFKLTRTLLLLKQAKFKLNQNGSFEAAVFNQNLTGKADTTTHGIQLIKEKTDLTSWSVTSDTP